MNTQPPTPSNSVITVVLLALAAFGVPAGVITAFVQNIDW